MLIGSSITLGPVVPEDFASLFCWANDAAAARLDFSYRPVDLIKHRQWCESIGNDPAKVIFAIRRLHATGIVGYVQIQNISAVHRSAEMGIRIGAEKDRGQGLGKDALRLAVAYCWNDLNLNRIQLIVFKHNERAIRAYQGVGFKREGLLRRAAFVDGVWVDLVVMGILRPRSAHRPSEYAFRAARSPAEGAAVEHVGRARAGVA